MRQADVACSEICADTGNREEFFGANPNRAIEFRAAVGNLGTVVAGKTFLTLFANFRSLASSTGNTSFQDDGRNSEPFWASWFSNSCWFEFSLGVAVRASLSLDRERAGLSKGLESELAAA